MTWTRSAADRQAAEDEARRRDPRLLVLDTDLVSTWVYSRHYYGDCPSWIEGAARERRADLYLLLGTDVPWVAEGDQREQPHRREELYALFRQALEQLDASFVEVRGTWAERRAAAIAAVETLLLQRGSQLPHS